MSDKNEPSEPEKANEASDQDANPDSETDSPNWNTGDAKNSQGATSPSQSVSLRVESGFVILGLIVAMIAQFFGQYSDHQNANIVTAVALAFAIIAILVAAHRKLRHLGRAIVPSATIASIVILAVLFRHDGFSGEMVPQFKWRFGGTIDRPLQTMPGVDAPQIEANDPDATADDRSTQAPDSVARSSQFLGNRRNGVIPRRDFAIPQSNHDVEVLWDIGVGSGWSSFSVSDGIAVTMEQRDDTEVLTAYDLRSGNLRWILQHKGLHQNPLGGIGPRSTPTIADGKVYANSATGHVWCVDLHSGEEIWSVELLKISGWTQAEFETAAPWGHASSPLIVDDFCVLSLGADAMTTVARGLVALDRQTGRTRWIAGEDQLSYASPMLLTLGGTRQVVSVNEKTVSGHQIDTGKLLWTFPWPGSSNTSANCASPLAVQENGVLVGKGYGGGSALYEVRQSDDGKWSATETWTSSRVLKTKFNHACIVGNIAYAISNGAVQAADLRDASSLWMQPRRSRSGQGQLLLVEDTLVVQKESGDVVFVEAQPESFVEKGQLTALTSKTWNIPTVAGRHLIVRNDRQAICFLLPKR